MATWLKQSTAVDIPMGPFLDETDGKTAETALTITQADIRLKKNNGNWAQKNAAQTLTHEEFGWYEVALDTTDTNTLGVLVIAIHESGALPVWREFMVVAAHVYDGMIAGGDFLQVDVIEWKSATAPAMTGDAFARLGAPAGASVSADIADLPTNAELATSQAAADDATLAVIATLQTSVDDLPTNAELATALGTADDATLAAISALNTLILDLPTNAELATALGTADDAVLSALTSMNTLILDIPTNAELATALGTADDAVLSALSAMNTLILDLPTNAELAAALGTADDAVITALAALSALVTAVKAKTDLIPGTQDGKTFAESVMLITSVLLSKCSGMHTTEAVFRNMSDTKDRVTATVDVHGNREAVTYDVS